MDRSNCQLGDRIPGILFSGAGEQDRALYIFRGTAKDHPGSYNARDFCHIFNYIFKRRIQMELRGRVFVYPRGGVLYFQEVVKLF